MARAKNELPDTSWSPLQGARVHVQALGACQVQIGNERLSPSSGTLFALVMRLVYSSGMQLSRDLLMSTLWPGQAESRQRGNLRQALYKLRRMDLFMELSGDTVRLDQNQVSLTFSIERTVENFERDVLQEHEPFGAFLPGYEPRSEQLSEWLNDIREVIHSDVRRVLVAELRKSRERVDWRTAETLCRWLLQFDPLNEEATLTLAECVALNGGKAQAIEMIDRYLEELGSDAGDIRIPATTLRRRLIDPGPRKIPIAPTERHFIGRAEEIAELTLAMRRTRWHDGSAYLIYGPPGMGKTRLTYELSKVASIEGLIQFRYSCHESDSMRHLSMALDLISDLLEAPGALGVSPETLRNLRRLVGDVHLPLGADGLPEPREPLPGPATIRRGIAELVAAVSEEKPVFIVVDDAHWLDRQSWDALADVIERTDGTRVSIVITSRAPHACHERPERITSRLRVKELKRLSSEEAVELAKRIASDLDCDSSEQAVHIVQCCDGVPLFVHGMVKHFIEFGSDEEYPTDITQIFDRKIEILSATAMRTLQVITLMQPRAQAINIEGVLNIPFIEVASALDELTAHDLIDISAEANVTCHALVSARVRVTISQATASLLHGRIGEQLIALDKDSGYWNVSTLRHILLSGDKTRTVELTIEAASHLYQRGDSHRLVHLLDELFERYEDTRKDDHIVRIYSDALYQCGKYVRILDLEKSNHVETIRETKEINDIGNLLRSIRAESYVDRGNILQVNRKLLEIAKSKQADVKQRAEAVELIIRLACDAVDKRTASVAYRSLSGIRDALSDITATRIDVTYNTFFGNLNLAHKCAKRLLLLSNDVQNPHERVPLLRTCAYSLRFSGDWNESVAVFERAFEEAEDIEHHAVACFCAYQLSLIALDRSNDLLESQRWNHLMLRMVDHLQEPQYLVTSAYHQVRISLENNDAYRASELIAAARRVSHSSTYSLRQRIYATALQMETTNQQRDSTLNERSLKQSLDLLSSSKSQPGNDFYYAALLTGLSKAGAVDDITRVTSEVKKYRRESSPMSFRLQSAMERAQTRVRRSAKPQRES